MSKLTDAILGLMVGDAMGVPVEFMPRAKLDENPVVTMRGDGTHKQPKGTWSDDSSMTLATLDSLLTCGRPDGHDAMRRFVAWYRDGMYTPYGEIFDIGNTTRLAIDNFMRGKMPCGLSEETSNGNGALMRILPVAFLPMPIARRLEVAREFAALTHAHERNLLACEFYIKVADNLINGVHDWLGDACSLITSRGVTDKSFSRLEKLNLLCRDEIKSTGYVIDTLEAALWCLLRTDNYRDCVLTAVNLGKDTDTVGACAGGLAAIKYGEQDIPREWLNAIPSLDWTRELCAKFIKRFNL
jgi:ADP-ribosylglycohydrolase